MKVAFLGTGAMGSGIAANIAAHEFSLRVWNSHIERAFPLREKGAEICEDLAEAVKDADVIGMCLTADDAVKQVCGKLYPLVKRGSVIFDCSTTSPGCPKEMQAKFAEKGVGFLDAPVSGGIAGANAGTLTVMVGGAEKDFEAAKPVLQAFSSYLERMGGIGAGQTTKLINQLLTGVNQATVCEAMLLAEKAGLDMEKLYALLLTAWGYSKMLERSVKEYIIPKKYESAACLQLMNKDLRLTLQMANQLGYKAPITATAAHFYNAAQENGWGKEDHSAIIKVMEQEDKL